MPQTAKFSYAEIIRNTLLKHLYESQYRFWRRQIEAIALTNARYHNRTGEVFGLHYLGKNWVGHGTLDPAEVTFLTLYTQYAPKIEKKLLTIVNELSLLEIEEYEASRFLSGLVLFPAPIEIFKKVLGKQLFSECEQELEQYLLNSTNYSWDANAQVAIMTYVAHHDYILKAMNQRLLINMITRDQTRQ